MQNEYHDFTRTLLQWRKGCKAVCYGDTRQYHVNNGVYVFARVLNGEVATVVMNGNDSETIVADLTQRYGEVLPKASAYEVISGKQVAIESAIKLAPHEVKVFDFSK